MTEATQIDDPTPQGAQAAAIEELTPGDVQSAVAVLNHIVRQYRGAVAAAKLLQDAPSLTTHRDEIKRTIAALKAEQDELTQQVAEARAFLAEADTLRAAIEAERQAARDDAAKIVADANIEATRVKSMAQHHVEQRLAHAQVEADERLRKATAEIDARTARAEAAEARAAQAVAAAKTMLGAIDS